MRMTSQRFGFSYIRAKLVRSLAAVETKWRRCVRFAEPWALLITICCTSLHTICAVYISYVTQSESCDSWLAPLPSQVLYTIRCAIFNMSSATDICSQFSLLHANQTVKVRQQDAYMTNESVQLKRFNTLPIFQGITDCMPLSSLLNTIKINSSIHCRRCIKIAILDEYLVHHCWK